MTVSKVAEWLLVSDQQVEEREARSSAGPLDALWAGSSRRKRLQVTRYM